MEDQPRPNPRINRPHIFSTQGSHCYQDVVLQVMWHMRSMRELFLSVDCEEESPECEHAVLVTSIDRYINDAANYGQVEGEWLDVKYLFSMAEELGFTM